MLKQREQEGKKERGEGIKGDEAVGERVADHAGHSKDQALL